MSKVLRLGGIVFGACGACVAVSLAAIACSTPVPMDNLPDDTNPSNDPAEITKKPVTDGTMVTQVDASAPDTAAPAACVTVPPNNKCGLAPQCGCGTNETCDVTSEATGATSCVSAGGATLGRPCSQTGDCLAGLTCAYGACRPYCGAANSKCAIGGTDLCVVVDSDATGMPVTNKNVCTINCDPRVPSAVCGTNACQWYPDLYAPAKISDCNFAGNIQGYSGHCVDTSDCVPGFACVNNSKHGLQCEAWCRLGQSPSDCPNNTQCKDVFGTEAPVIAGVTEGACE